MIASRVRPRPTVALAEEDLLWAHKNKKNIISSSGICETNNTYTPPYPPNMSKYLHPCSGICLQSQEASANLQLSMKNNPLDIESIALKVKDWAVNLATNAAASNKPMYAFMFVSLLWVPSAWHFNNFPFLIAWAALSVIFVTFYLIVLHVDPNKHHSENYLILMAQIELGSKQIPTFEPSSSDVVRPSQQIGAGEKQQ